MIIAMIDNRNLKYVKKKYFGKDKVITYKRNYIYGKNKQN